MIINGTIFSWPILHLSNLQMQISKQIVLQSGLQPAVYHEIYLLYKLQRNIR